MTTQLTRIRLNNIVSFKDAEIDIANNNGFVVVQGINRDSNIANNTNGAGKSLLFGTLPVALYEADPLALVKRNKKDIHQKKGSLVEIEFKSLAGQDIRYVQHGSKYQFFIDGEDQKTQTQDIARSRLAEHWPLREEEFYTTCYINSQRMCDFQKSKPSQRLDFITHLFGLHVYDKLRAHFAKKKAEIKDREIEFQTLAVQVESVERDLSKVKWNKASNQKLKEARADLEETSKELEALYQDRKDIEIQRDLLESFESCLSKYFSSIEELVAHETDLDLFVKRLNQQLDYLDDKDAYQQDLKKYKSKKRDLTSKQKSLQREIRALGKIPVKKLQALIEQHEDKLEQLKERSRKYDQQMEDEKDRIEQIDALIGEINEIGYDSIAAVDMEIDVAEDLAMAKALVSLAENLDGHSTCPTCNQKVNIKNIEKQARRAKSRIAELQDLKTAQKCVAEYQSLEKEAIDIKALERKVKKMLSSVAKVKSALDNYLDLQDALKDLSRVEESLKDLAAPKKPRGRVYYKSIPDNELEDYIDYCKIAVRLETQIHQQLTSIGSKKLARLFTQGEEKDLREMVSDLLKKAKLEEHRCSKKRKHLQSKSNGLNETVVRLETAKSNWKLLQEQKMELDSKMEEAKPILAEKKLVDALFSAYGNTNLKLYGATKILKLLEANLNQYSHLVFPETMHFKLDAGSTGIDAIAIRKDGTPSDISKLSGAETNCFRLLLAISLLPLLPAERRTNFMILDEPDSACSDAVREHLAKEFIPKLRALVPHVFWITPKDKDVFKEAETWLIEKEQGTSSIKTGV